MMFPQTPSDAKQTNCWKFVLILGTVGHLITIVGIIATSFDTQSRNGTEHVHRGEKNGNIYFIIQALISQVLEAFCFIVIMYHTRYAKLSVNDYEMEITMGPWRWPLLKWIFSSQVRKNEIHGVERKQRSVVDIILRQYCMPVHWCCCHKSYSSYFWPFCCDCSNECNLCEGDSPTSDMIQINLTDDPCSFGTMCCKRCAPCAGSNPCTCFVYNRIAFAIKDETWVDQFRNHGYPFKEYLITYPTNTNVNSNPSVPTAVEEPRQVLI